MRPAILLLFVLCSTLVATAQVPQKFSTQLVVRDASTELITEDVVRVRISILQGTSTGTLSYSEVHTPFTNANGLASLEIGTGATVTGSIATIDWSDGPYFIQTEVDPTGGTDYTIDGTTELLSVPYALHAGSDDDWSVNESDIYVPEGIKVGIGTDAPTAPLTVVGNALINGITVGLGPNAAQQNTVVGEAAMMNNAIGYGNTGVGYHALFGTSGVTNTAIGLFSLSGLQAGESNTAIGAFSGGSFGESGEGMTFIGANAIGNSNVNNSTAIGFNAQVKQSNSLILGDEGVKVGISVDGRPNEMLEVGNTGRAFFGDGNNMNRKGLLIVGSNATAVARLEAYDYGSAAPMALGLNTSGGNVGIRMNDPSVALDVLGSIEYTGTITDVSDERLKENFEPIVGAVESLTKIKGYTYNMKDEVDVREYGVIAQEIQKVFPEMVTVVDEENGYLGVSYVQLIPVLLEAIKEQNALEKELRSRLDSQEEFIKEISRTLQSMSADH